MVITEPPYSKKRPVHFRLFTHTKPTFLKVKHQNRHPKIWICTIPPLYSAETRHFGQNYNKTAVP